jgi:hypothetical protein
MQKELKYITFDQLMASVESDLSTYADNNMINRGICLKIARKVNHDLGLKIFRERETTLKIVDYKADLPEDFMYLQLALICKDPIQFSMPAGSILGTHTQETDVIVPCVKPDKTCLNSNGGSFWVTQIFKEKTIKVSNLMPIRISKKGLKFCSDNCINTGWSGAYEMDIQEGQIVTNFREGDVYINYLSDMVDLENNILILDHPLVTGYYEYAIKKHLLEGFMINGEADVERKLSYIAEQLKEARIAALNFTNTVEYTDIQDIFRANRLRFYNKYHKMFYAW